MKKIAVIYGSSSGNTQTVAEQIKSKLKDHEITLMDVSTINADDLEPFDNIILGSSTWGFGDLQDDWESFLPQLKNSSLQGKTIAFYGLGDSSAYPDTFVDAIGILYDIVKEKGGNIIGDVESSEYSFSESKAVQGDKFIGLPLDKDNESSMTNKRLDLWLEKIVPLFK